MNCPYCDRPNENNPSDYYHRKECEARILRHARKIATEYGACDTVRLWIDKRLEMAEFVGD